MSLSNLDKNHLEKLLIMINKENANKIDTVKNNYMHFGKIKLICEQIYNLKEKGMKILKKNNNCLELDINNNSNDLLKKVFIKKGSYDYLKLKIIWEEIIELRDKANLIVKEAVVQEELQKLKCGFKLVSGTHYYLYEKKSKKYFSLIAPDEWSRNDESRVFLNKYLYDYDKSFVLIE